MEVFSALSQLVHSRRNIKTAQMNGKHIPNETIAHILELANWAPNHGSTEPWRFVVFSPATKSKFCEHHAELYRQHADPAKYTDVTFNNLQHMGDNASHIIIAYTKRGPLPKIPMVEEIIASSCAIQNLLLGATALGLVCYWGTGGMMHNPVMKQYLELGEDDVILGALYLGYSDLEKEGKRNTPITDKTVWK